MRVREAIRFAPNVETNLGFVSISDQTIDQISKDCLAGFTAFTGPVTSMAASCANSPAREQRQSHSTSSSPNRGPDHSPVPVSVAKWPEAAGFSPRCARRRLSHVRGTRRKANPHGIGRFFAWQLKALWHRNPGSRPGIQPISLFATQALAVADISADSRIRTAFCGVSKRFGCIGKWHPLFQRAERDPRSASISIGFVEAGRIVLPRQGLEPIRVPVDNEKLFELADVLVIESPPAGPGKPRPLPKSASGTWASRSQHRRSGSI